MRVLKKPTLFQPYGRTKMKEKIILIAAREVARLVGGFVKEKIIKKKKKEVKT